MAVMVAVMVAAKVSSTTASSTLTCQRSESVGAWWSARAEHMHRHKPLMQAYTRLGRHESRVAHGCTSAHLHARAMPPIARRSTTALSTLTCQRSESVGDVVANLQRNG